MNLIESKNNFFLSRRMINQEIVIICVNILHFWKENKNHCTQSNIYLFEATQCNFCSQDSQFPIRYFKPAQSPIGYFQHGDTLMNADGSIC